MARFPHRVTPIDRIGIVRNRRGSIRFRYRVGQPADYIFTADIYPYRDLAHPERHLGWWRFALPPGSGMAELVFDFAPVRRDSVSLRVSGSPIPIVDCWWNPDFPFEPLGDVELVVRSADGTTRSSRSVLLKYMDRDILRDFYARHYASHGYTPHPDAPFLPELHAYKLRALRTLFERHIPAGGLVADVGCGRSLFAEIGDSFPFTVVAGDLNFASVRDRAGQVPHQQWGVFDASALPFADATFDALFAGEVIEHVPDAVSTLREWRRVLKPGGIAIITTPNRDRLVARVNRREVPYSPDHLGELSYRDLTRRLLPAGGFEFVQQACIYLELWLKHLFNRSRLAEDFLQGKGDLRKHVPIMRKLFPLGRWFPSASLAMIIVARKSR